MQMYPGSRVLAPRRVCDNNVLSILVRKTLNPDPQVRAANAAIIPIAGFLLPYLNNTPDKGIITTYDKSPVKLRSIHINTNTNVILFSIFCKKCNSSF